MAILLLLARNRDWEKFVFHRVGLPLESLSERDFGHLMVLMESAVPICCNVPEQFQSIATHTPTFPVERLRFHQFNSRHIIVVDGNDDIFGRKKRSGRGMVRWIIGER